MTPGIPERMNAAVLHRFDGPEELVPATIPVPDLGPGEIFIRVDTAGVGEWDPFQAGTFPLRKAARAHRAPERHCLGKPVMSVRTR